MSPGLRDHAPSSAVTAARLTAAPRLAAAAGGDAGRLGAGVHRLGLDERRDALLYVPPDHRRETAAALAVMLHGAGGTAEHGLTLLGAVPADAGPIVLAPASRGGTWDVIVGGYGPDVEFIDRALEAVFDRCAIDAGRVAIGGFSDGASYALSLGLTNGDLFSHILAFSPGFALPGVPVGRPRVLVSHGEHDGVLPIDRCSRVIVPRLRRAGYEVVYQEFDGGHTVPDETARRAVEWFMG